MEKTQTTFVTNYYLETVSRAVLADLNDGTSCSSVVSLLLWYGLVISAVC